MILFTLIKIITKIIASTKMRFLYTFLLIFFFQSFLYQPFKIPSTSMEPNLKIGDYLFVKKFSYNYNKNSLVFFLNKFIIYNNIIRFSKPKRGDVVVFLLDDGKYYIKRIVGLPGDLIQFINGRLLINNKMCTTLITINNSKEHKFLFKEQLSKKALYNIQLNKYSDLFSFPNTTPIYTVPEHKYFLIGDNRNDSEDSRFLERIGYISENNIIGKASLIFWTESFFKKFDYNRLLSTIK